MRQSSTNPANNAVPPSVKESTLVDAIQTSGYPLQGIIAEKLIDAGFSVVEEWGFIDKDTNEHRSLDVIGFRRYAGAKDPVVPGLELLIECKRTVHPYVFFKKVSKVPPNIFPIVSGVKLSIEEPTRIGSRSYPSASIPLVLDLDGLPFVQDPPRCASFSKATLGSKKVTLSGEEPFNQIILPLVKSLRFKIDLDTVFIRHANAWPTLLLCIGVLDAPMLLVESPSEAKDPLLTPWVRVFRLQANEKRDTDSHAFYAIDLVHVDAFDEFLANHLAPFVEQFCTRSLALGSTWKRGGVVTDLENIRWNEIQPKTG